jgi:glycerophosphoryl diester phosphodiesterase
MFAAGEAFSHALFKEHAMYDTDSPARYKIRLLGQSFFAVLWIIACLCDAGWAQWPANVDIIGHRGDSGNAPENTLPSLNLAFAKGALAVEADIRLSKSGTLTLMHDEKVDRTTDGRGFINKKSDSQLAALDAGSWFGAEFANTPIPTLVDALTAANGQGVMYMDLKLTGLAQKVLNDVNATGFPQGDLWLWAQGLESEVAQLHSTLPDAKIIWSGGPFNGKTWQDPGYFDDLLNAGVWAVDVAWDFTWQGGGPLRDTPEFINAARNAGVYVSTYALDHQNTMAEAIYRGVNGFETNFPERVAPLLDSASGTSTLHFQAMGSNVAVPENFGGWNSMAVTGTSVTGDGTPWVEVEWSVKNPSGTAAWEFYNDAEWDGAAQLNDFTNADGFDILIAPAGDFAVTVDSFVFDDYAGFDLIGSAFTWALYKDDENGAVIGGGTEVLGDGEDLFVSTGMNQAYAGPVLLRISAANNPAGAFGGFDSAITDLVFSMSPAGGGGSMAAKSAPEPTSLVLMAFAMLVLWAHRQSR